MARAKLRDGAERFERGDYVGALAVFEEAQSIFNSPKIHYNIAMAYEKLGRNGPAFTAYEKFLRLARDSKPEHVAHSRRELERLAKHLALVRLVSDVADAEVIVDGLLVGKTPLPSRLPVETGPHDIEIRTADGGTRTQQFTAVAGETMELRLDLGPTGAGDADAGKRRPPDSVARRSLVSTNRTGAAADESVRGTEQIPAGKWPPSKILGAILIATSGAAVAGGTVLLLLDGAGTCAAEPGFVCDRQRDTKVLGWALIGGGLASGLIGGILVHRSSSTQISASLSPPGVLAGGRF
jgi:hypothetical protein